MNSPERRAELLRSLASMASVDAGKYRAKAARLETPPQLITLGTPYDSDVAGAALKSAREAFEGSYAVARAVTLKSARLAEKCSEASADLADSVVGQTLVIRYFEEYDALPEGQGLWFTPGIAPLVGHDLFGSEDYGPLHPTSVGRAVYQAMTVPS